MDAKVFDTGVVIITNNLKLYAITDFNEPRPKALANVGLLQPPFSWIVIPPNVSLSKHAEVLLAVNQTVLSVDSIGAQDQVTSISYVFCS